MLSSGLLRGWSWEKSTVVPTTKMLYWLSIAKPYQDCRRFLVQSAARHPGAKRSTTRAAGRTSNKPHLYKAMVRSNLNLHKQDWPQDLFVVLAWVGQCCRCAVLCVWVSMSEDWVLSAYSLDPWRQWPPLFLFFFAMILIRPSSRGRWLERMTLMTELGLAGEWGVGSL